MSSVSSKIDELQHNLFSQLESVIGPRDEDNKFDDDLLSMPTNNSNRNDNAGPYDNKYEYMSSMAKHHVDI